MTIRLGKPTSLQSGITRERYPCPNRSTFTEIEGEWDEVFDVVKRATEAVAPFGSRVSLVMKADIRPGFTGELDAKLERSEAGLEGDKK